MVVKYNILCFFFRKGEYKGEEEIGCVFRGVVFQLGREISLLRKVRYERERELCFGQRKGFLFVFGCLIGLYLVFF